MTNVQRGVRVDTEQERIVRMDMTHQNGGFEARREKLLDVLTSPEMAKGSYNSGSWVNDAHYSNRVSWQYYTACMARGIKLDEANDYFANSNEIEAVEWNTLCYIRTYFQFKDTVLSKPAADRLLKTIQEYKEKAMDGPERTTPERHGTLGNHSIVAFSFYLLADQALGNGPKHDIAREKFIDWAQYHGRYGRDEVNSPHYLDRSLLPLLNLYDFIEDPKLKLWAQMAIDKMVSDFALLSLKNVRGGPWCRAHNNHAPFVIEHRDGRHNTFYVAGYQLFGDSAVPEYIFTDQIMNYGFLITTSYRPPAVSCRLADSASRGSYEVKSYRKANAKPRAFQEEWDMYYYMTPSFSLASLQDRIELDNHMTNGTTRPPDFVNTQVWELTFSDPTKKLGPMRNLNVLTGGYENIHEVDNPNTANMQYKNVLFYKGNFLDYNHNLHEGGGSYTREQVGDKALNFWHVHTNEGSVYVGITNYPRAFAGIMEVGRAEDYESYDAFKKAIIDAPASCKDTGKETSYTSTKGDEISYTNPTGNPGDGSATVNGAEFPIHGYKHYDSPWIKSEQWAGVMEMEKDGSSLVLDFRDRENPDRRESMS
ncbi:hypothetical protein ACFL6S_13120 [Candidatus Poribacteria bacterium]